MQFSEHQAQYLLIMGESEQFNVNVKATPGESPWSNYIVECHNAVLGKMVNKLMLNKNNKYPVEIIVACAVSAKNAWHNCFGKKPNFLSNSTNKPPAKANITHSQLVLKHLNAIHTARKAFIEAESNKKLHRALK